MFREASTALIQRANYSPPAYWIDTVDLSFDLDPAKTRVLNKMQIRRNADVPAQPLRLDGDELNLARVMVNGQGCSFKMDGDTLVLENLPDGLRAGDFHHLQPGQKHQADGLVRQPRHLFHPVRGRRLSPHHLFFGPPGRDGEYTVTLRADARPIPVLLSNGNLVEQGAAGRWPPFRQMG